jgi:hypothetical protein
MVFHKCGIKAVRPTAPNRAARGGHPANGLFASTSLAHSELSENTSHCWQDDSGSLLNGSSTGFFASSTIQRCAACKDRTIPALSRVETAKRGPLPTLRARAAHVIFLRSVRPRTSGGVGKGRMDQRIGRVHEGSYEGRDRGGTTIHGQLLCPLHSALGCLNSR